MRHLKRASEWFTLITLAFLTVALSAVAADLVITEKKAAEVNGVTITMMALNGEYRQVLKQQGMSSEEMDAGQALEIKKGVLDSLINEELLYQECQKNNISATEENVNASLVKTKESFQDEDAYQSALKDANMQESDIIARIRRALAINTLVDEKVGQKVVVTDEEVVEYYDTHPDSFRITEKVRASHILVKVDKDDDESKKALAEEKINALQRRLKEGEDFANLAKENSDCPSSENGGELGYFERGKMVQEFEDAAFALSPGEAGDIVQTDYGYHLILVTDKIEEGTISYETVKPDLEDYLMRQKISLGVASLIEMLREEARIETYLEASS